MAGVGGFTVDEIVEFVHEYEVQRYGCKNSWLAEQGLSSSYVRQSGVRIPVSVSLRVGDGHRVILRVISHNRLEEGHHDDRHDKY